ncbi:hypothetical protein F5Y01DRAFT_51018 [Xylaria sp. FL0043]|nr:hypothetical protein F5Y01DRAFT_51018 [Xylaria sp. FL0043]
MSIAPADLPREAKCIPPIPVPTHGPGGVFTVACTTDIAGPAIKVLEKVLDLPHYGSWNTFVPRASVISTPPSGGSNENENTRDEALAPEVRELVARPGFAARGAKIRFEVVMRPGSSSSRAVELEVTFLEAFSITVPTSTTSTTAAPAPATGEDGQEGSRKGYRIAWKATGMRHFLLHSERVQEFVETVAEDGSVVTRYTTWETFGGVLGYVLPRTQIEGGFARWTAGLKKVVEEGDK